MSSSPPECIPWWYKFVGVCAQIELRKKVQERELATFDEKSTSSGIAAPYAQ